MAQPIICTVYVTGNAGMPGRADSGKTRFRKQTQKARWTLSLSLSGASKLSGRESFSPIWPWKRTWMYLSQEFLFSCIKTRGFTLIWWIGCSPSVAVWEWHRWLKHKDGGGDGAHSPKDGVSVPCWKCFRTQMHSKSKSHFYLLSHVHSTISNHQCRT